MLPRRTIAAMLAASALAVPGLAAAQPADMHASTAIAAAKAQQPQQQDLRSPDAADAALHPRKSPVVVNAPGATVVDSQATGTPLPMGRPARAVAVPAQPAPATAGDDGTDWATIAIGAGLTVLILGGIALVSRSKALPRTRLSA